MRNKLLIILCLVPSLALAVETVNIAPLTIGVKSRVTSVAGTAVAVPTTALVGRNSIAIRNKDANTETIWCGASDVTSANGFPIDSATPSLTVDVDDSVIIYCISDGTAVSVSTLEAK